MEGYLQGRGGNNINEQSDVDGLERKPKTGMKNQRWHICW
jgi:hypothetical protein